MRTFFGGMASSFCVRVTSPCTSRVPFETMRTLSSSDSWLRTFWFGSTWMVVQVLERSVRACMTAALTSWSRPPPAAGAVRACSGDLVPAGDMLLRGFSVATFPGPGSDCTMRLSAGTCRAICTIRGLPKARSAKAASSTSVLRTPTMLGFSQCAAPQTHSSAIASSPSRKWRSPKRVPRPTSVLWPAPAASGYKATTPEKSMKLRWPLGGGQVALSCSPPKTQRPLESLRNGMARSSRSSWLSSKRWKKSGKTGRSALPRAFSRARRSICSFAGTRRRAFSVPSTICRFR
mmetsp:Transcript_65365/g.181334  ORF Transcript_65365/g.181334 Transcript_65365/m.181334 type:complete len:291 (+) Transcript_65365:1336-2208(+)